MDERQLRFPVWQGPLRGLILEFDRDKIAVKAEEVERLIFERRQQLSKEDDSALEELALNDAMNILESFRRSMSLIQVSGQNDPTNDLCHPQFREPAKGESERRGSHDLPIFKRGGKQL